MQRSGNLEIKRIITTFSVLTGFAITLVLFGAMLWGSAYNAASSPVIMFDITPWITVQTKTALSLSSTVTTYTKVVYGYGQVTSLSANPTEVANRGFVDIYVNGTLRFANLLVNSAGKYEFKISGWRPGTYNIVAVYKDVQNPNSPYKLATSQSTSVILTLAQ